MVVSITGAEALRFGDRKRERKGGRGMDQWQNVDGGDEIKTLEAQYQ